MDPNAAAQPPRLPGTDQPSAEQRAVDSFRALVTSYAEGITKHNGIIAGVDAELAALDEAKARLQRKRNAEVAERNVKFDLMEGVQQMIRAQEDKQLAKERADEDAARKAALS